MARGVRVMTGEQVRTIRAAQGWTLEHMATILGFTGQRRAQHMHDIETGRRGITYAQANLLLAIVQGYVPTDLVVDGVATPKILPTKEGPVYDPANLPRRVLSVLGDGLVSNRGVVRLGSGMMHQKLVRSGLMKANGELTPLAHSVLESAKTTSTPLAPANRLWRQP